MGRKTLVGKRIVQPCPRSPKVHHLSNNRKPAKLVKGQQTLHKYAGNRSPEKKCDMSHKVPGSIACDQALTVRHSGQLL
jgi:hypothetical protein